MSKAGSHAVSGAADIGVWKKWPSYESPHAKTRARTRAVCSHADKSCGVSRHAFQECFDGQREIICIVASESSLNATQQRTHGNMDNEYPIRAMAMCRSGQCTARTVAWNRTLAVQRHTKYICPQQGVRKPLNSLKFYGRTSLCIRSERNGKFQWSIPLVQFNSTHSFDLPLFWPGKAVVDQHSIQSECQAENVCI